MDHEGDNPFDTIESAQQFMELLLEAVEEARGDVEADTARSQPDRRMQAFHLVEYNLSKLEMHVATSRRILNDLRTLRRLLLQEREAENRPERPEPDAALPVSGIQASPDE